MPSQAAAILIRCGPTDAPPHLPSEGLLQALPDLPRWVEIRGMLLSGRGKAMGSSADAFVVSQPDVGLAGVVGKPDAEVIRQVCVGCREVLAVPEDAEVVGSALPDWTVEPASLHVLSAGDRLPGVEPGLVRTIEPAEWAGLPGLPEDLREELLIEARAGTTIAAAFADGQPVSFCYAGFETELWWDISIDTVDGYRRRGYAARCVTFQIARFDKLGKCPVWGALASNNASARLASRLGFVKADELIVFQPPAVATE